MPTDSDGLLPATWFTEESKFQKILLRIILKLIRVSPVASRSIRIILKHKHTGLDETIKISHRKLLLFERNILPGGTTTIITVGYKKSGFPMEADLTTREGCRKITLPVFRRDI